MKPVSQSIKTLSFFSGIRGLDIGFESYPFDVQAYCESDIYCRQSIDQDTQKPVLTTVTDMLLHYSQTDVCIAGVPCQPFSTAGTRTGFSHPYGNLFFEFLDTAIALQPRYIVMENVVGLLITPITRDTNLVPTTLHHYKGSALAAILIYLAHHGYTSSFKVYNMADFGVPQHRKRVILIATTDRRKPPYLTETHGHGLLPYVTFKDVTSRLRTVTALPLRPDQRPFIRYISACANWRALPIDLQIKALGKAFHNGGGNTGYLRRLCYHKPSPTLLTHPNLKSTALIHPTQERTLSIEEYRKLQSLPDTISLTGSLLNQYKQVGNAVPPVFSQQLAKLLRYLIYRRDYSAIASHHPQGLTDITWSTTLAPPLADYLFDQVFH